MAIFLITISVGLDWHLSSSIPLFPVTVFSALCLRGLTTFTLVTFHAKLWYLHTRLHIVIIQSTVIWAVEIQTCPYVLNTNAFCGCLHFIRTMCKKWVWNCFTSVTAYIFSFVWCDKLLFLMVKFVFVSFNIFVKNTKFCLNKFKLTVKVCQNSICYDI